MNKKYFSYLACFAVVGFSSSASGHGIFDGVYGFVSYCAPFWACLMFSYSYSGK